MRLFVLSQNRDYYRELDLITGLPITEWIQVNKGLFKYKKRKKTPKKEQPTWSRPRRPF